METTSVSTHENHQPGEKYGLRQVTPIRVEIVAFDNKPALTEEEDEWNRKANNRYKLAKTYNRLVM